jgi:hypothetical protein
MQPAREQLDSPLDCRPNTTILRIHSICKKRECGSVTVVLLHFRLTLFPYQHSPLFVSYERKLWNVSSQFRRHFSAESMRLLLFNELFFSFIYSFLNICALYTNILDLCTSIIYINVCLLSLWPFNVGSRIVSYMRLFRIYFFPLNRSRDGSCLIRYPSNYHVSLKCCHRQITWSTEAFVWYHYFL